MVTDLNYPLLKFSSNLQDWWFLRDAVRGVQIFGGIGSGKTSGSGKTLAHEFLKSGFGGIVLVGKVDETETWIEYAKAAGRSQDLIIFSEHTSRYAERYGELSHLKDQSYKFDPLIYEMNPDREGGGQTDNIVALFMALVKMGGRVGSSGGGGERDPFWDMATERCIKSAVDLLKLAKKAKLAAKKRTLVEFEIAGLSEDTNRHEPEGKNLDDSFDVTIPNIAKIIRDAPVGAGHYGKFSSLSPSGSENAHKRLQEWAKESYTVYCLSWADSFVESADCTASDQRAYDVAKGYFLSEFASLADRTRSSITEYFYAFANPFRSGLLADFFTSEVSEAIMPEVTFEGKIIVLDFPVKKYLQLGVYAQAIYKRIWQQAVERRNTKTHPSPVFMWIDEAQYFLNEEDMMFQTTARSSKACTVLLSQNISNYYATIGGAHPVERVNSLLGNLATKIFHSNNDHVTNSWAAETIGKTFQTQRGVSVGQLENVSINKALNYQVEPQEFTTLRGGGEMDDFQVDAIITVAGKKWSDGRNYIERSFNQLI